MNNNNNELGSLEKLLALMLETWENRYEFRLDRDERYIKFSIPGLDIYAYEMENDQIKIHIEVEGQIFTKIGSIEQTANVLQATMFPK